MRLKRAISTLTAVALPLFGHADSKVTMDVSVQNPPASASIRVPAQGTYEFLLAKDRVCVNCPGGKKLILDFDKKVVSLLDMTQKTFQQQKLDEYLGFGEKLPTDVGNAFSKRTTITFQQMVGQEGRSIMGQSATPYNLDLQADLTRQSPQGRQNGGFGRHRGGGGGGIPGVGSYGAFDASAIQGRFPGDPGAAGISLASRGCQVAGELWLSSFAPGDCDREQLSIAEACAIMRGAPGLKALADHLRRAKLALMAGDFSVSILDDQGHPPAKPPVVSATLNNVVPAQLTLADFAIPAEFSKIPAPELPLGTTD